MKYIFTDDSGNVCVGAGAPKDQIEQLLGPLTDQQYEDHIIQTSIPPGSKFYSELPEDWKGHDIDFHGAWRQDPQDPLNIFIDMPVAREIWRDKMRRARAPILADLDVQFVRAMEEAQPVAAIVFQKQALRDVTSDPAIEAASTPAELIAVWPAALLTTAEAA
jgi:hypothetical protein